MGPDKEFLKARFNKNLENAHVDLIHIIIKNLVKYLFQIFSNILSYQAVCSF